MGTSNPSPDAIQNVKIHFERQPDYTREMTLRATNEEYKVEYVLQVDRAKLKNVVNSDQSEDARNEKDDQRKETTRVFKNEKDKLSEIKRETGSDPEKILEQSLALFKSIPNFSSMDEKEKILVVADIINGKYDGVIFSENDSVKPEQKLNKFVKAYKDGETTKSRV